jgi:hypothetical protein
MAQDVPFLRLDDGLSLPAFNEQEHNVRVSHQCGLLLRVWLYVQLPFLPLAFLLSRLATRTSPMLQKSWI